MNAKASISNGYRWRLGIIALMCIGWGLYCLYDGFIAYPAENAHYERYEAIKQAHPDTWRDEWDRLALENNLPINPSELEHHEPWDIYAQYIMAAVTLPIGLLFGVAFMRAKSRWIAGDEQGLHTSWGQHAPWDAITSVDKTRWKSKGIAVVYYRDPAGNGERRITLDDWKYEREPTTALVAAVDAKLGNTASELGADASPQEQAAP